MIISEPRATLSIDAIQAMLAAAIARSRALGVKVHIAIVDSRGNSAGAVSFPGAPRIAEVSARRKAHTSLHTGGTTAQLEQYLATIPASELNIIDSIPGYIAAIGGYPLVEHGLVLGSIGVSGAAQEIDGDIAEAALKALQG